MKTISSQRYIDDGIVEAKRTARDYDVAVSPEFEFDGQTFRVILDGHHSLEAAMLDGAEPVFVEQTNRDNDTIGLIERGDIEGFLGANRIDSDWYDVRSGRDIW